MGLEIEMQNMRLTFKRTDLGRSTDYTLWPHPKAPLTMVEETMIKHNPILVPDIPQYAAQFPDIDQIKWEADWGFIVAGDSFSPEVTTFAATGTLLPYSKCSLELQFAANFIHEGVYWAFARRAAGVFREVSSSFSGIAAC